MQNVKHLTKESVKKDIDSILWSFRLQKIKRFYNQKYWTEESRESRYASKIERGYRLESVAEHSWTVADSVLILAPYFPTLDFGRALKIAILHDKMEIIAGDPSPVGRDGTGMNAHAFSSLHALEKDEKEKLAIEQYVSSLREHIQTQQKTLLLESLECKSPEARFVKAIDKLQATAFIFVKKMGDLEDKHLLFLDKFHKKNIKYFPPLEHHYNELSNRLLKQVARKRGISRAELLENLQNENSQLELFSNLNLKIKADDTKNSQLTKKERIFKLFQELDKLPASKSALEAYQQISYTLNNIEDDYLGKDSWNPPRHYPPEQSTERLYIISAESMFPCPDYSGVYQLISVNEVIYISRYGAIEARNKQKNSGDISGDVLYKRNDAYGDGVWNDKNK